MLDIHMHPASGRYVLVNSITGIVLSKRNGYPKTYRSVKAACRARNKLTKRFNKMIGRLKTR